MTQADIDAGEVENTATADSTQSGPDDDTETVDLPQSATISIDKEGTFNDENADLNADVGETISYTFEVTNTGNVTLTGVTVLDPLSGLSAIDCPATTVAVGDSITCTATYTVTQADIDAGEVENTATADSTQSGPDDDTETVDLPQSATISIDKEGTFNDENAHLNADVGETISYTFEVANTGNVTLTGVTVLDPPSGLSAIDCPATTVAVGDSITCTATYTVTQADIDAGEVENTATAELDPVRPRR